MEGEIYVDPDEDEVFFMDLATPAQLAALAERRKRKTMVFHQKSDNKENVSVNIPKTISPIKKNTPYREPLTDEDKDYYPEEALTPARLNFEEASHDKSNDSDLLVMDSLVNESMVSWASVDVNTQLESLVANMETLLDDEDDDTEFYASSTPQKLEKSFSLKMALRADNDGGYLSALSEAAVALENVPSVVVTAPTPDQEVKPSPAPLVFSQKKIRRPFNLVYREEKSSSSSGSSYGTPAAVPSVPFLKPTVANIPKSSGLKPKKTPSKIPTGIKQSASKSLQFNHIESPVTKYIHQKSTPLVCNVKPKKSTWVVDDAPKKVESFSKRDDMPELPAARYQKGIPLKQEKAMESKLPRLGPVQLNKIKPLSPRIVKHMGRDNDVSVLVSSEAKISKTPKK